MFALSQALLLFQALPYVALLIAMLFFIYAVIGMQVRSSASPPGPLWYVAPDLWQAVPWPGGLDRQVMSFQPVALAAEEL